MAKAMKVQPIAAQDSFCVETRIPEARKSDGYTFQRTILSCDGGTTIETAREAAWKNVAYYGCDPETGYSPVGYIISAVCGACQGRGKVHRARRRSWCNRGMHSDSGCWLPCPTCNDQPYRVVETTEERP